MEIRLREVLSFLHTRKASESITFLPGYEERERRRRNFGQIRCLTLPLPEKRARNF